MTRKAFYVLNIVMLFEFCRMYTKLLSAPYELAAVATGTSNHIPSVIFIVMAVIIGAVFFRTLTVKLPSLMNEERIAGVWRYMFLVPLVMSALIHWMTPRSPIVVMTGRVRPISLVLVTFVAVSAFMFYHIFWWTASYLTETARLQQENTFLSMEAKRYDELRSYMNHSRAMRHDFRQHILVIRQLTESGQIDELREYISDLAEASSGGYVNYCANPAVDAVASHYDHLAKSQDTSITWRLELPAVLPVRESDYCAIFGNLIENALHAVKSLSHEQRKVNVISSMLSRFMLGISIDNPYSDKIIFGKDGLPVSSGEGHGIGLVSVMNTVNRYGGSMSITAEGGKFSADIILYSDS